MTSSLHGPYGLGNTRATMAITMGSKAIRRSESEKIASVRIVLATREHEVGIASNRGSACRGEYVPGPVHTARHTPGIGFARSIGPMITHDFYGTLVPQRPLVVLLAHTTVGSLTGVKSGRRPLPLWWRAGEGSKGHVAGASPKSNCSIFLLVHQSEIKTYRALR
ncbi:hypothetical protein RND71_015778 [Anisodus tanguticus]|uniref:Uncharacterized protein n=1 Tax=Anisodus tanguticus TaxID=243964 RepID=A0AAE1VLE7_9SOLA|nr:hypothetical protein RND71_015778 [Anisodus tanguticus]